MIDESSKSPKTNVCGAPGLKFCRADFILIVVLILAGLIPLAIGGLIRSRDGADGTAAVLTVAGTERFRCPIHEEMEPVVYTAEIDGLEITVSVDSSGARITHSDCPDQICVRTGKISEAGQSAVCVPLRAILRIETDGTPAGSARVNESDTIDAVAE